MRDYHFYQKQANDFLALAETSENVFLRAYLYRASLYLQKAALLTMPSGDGQENEEAEKYTEAAIKSLETAYLAALPDEYAYIMVSAMASNLCARDILKLQKKIESLHQKMPFLTPDEDCHAQFLEHLESEKAK